MGPTRSNIIGIGSIGASATDIHYYVDYKSGQEQ